MTRWGEEGGGGVWWTLDDGAQNVETAVNRAPATRRERTRRAADRVGNGVSSGDEPAGGVGAMRYRCFRNRDR